MNIPPYDNNAEQGVLGACMKSAEGVARAIALLGPDDFYATRHKKIFAALTETFKAGEPVDILSLADRLRKAGQLEDAGGLDYLDALDERMPTIEAVEWHANIVREKATLRALQQIGLKISAAAMANTDSPDDILNRAQQAIFKITERGKENKFVSAAKEITPFFQRLEERANAPESVTGVPTGFDELDAITSGLHPGNLIIIAARPGMGKSALAMDIARNAAILKNIPTCFFSLEMTTEEQMLRLVSGQSGVDSRKFKIARFSEQDWPKITGAVAEIQKAEILINDTPGLMVLDIRAMTWRAKIENRVGLVIVDYLQLLSVSGRFENRQQEITQISRLLKNTAKELSVPVIALAQLNRAVEARQNKTPILSDLRESGSIEQEADVVMFITRPDPLDTKAIIHLRKQRNGVAWGDFELYFDGPTTSFKNPGWKGMGRQSGINHWND